MDRAPIIYQLVSMRAQIDALLALLTSGEDGACIHPPDKRLNLTTMGGPTKWQCRLCDHEHEEPA